MVNHEYITIGEGDFVSSALTFSGFRTSTYPFDFAQCSIASVASCLFDLSNLDIVTVVDKFIPNVGEIYNKYSMQMSNYIPYDAADRVKIVANMRHKLSALLRTLNSESNLITFVHVGSPTNEDVMSFMHIMYSNFICKFNVSIYTESELTVHSKYVKIHRLSHIDVDVLTALFSESL